MDPAVLIQAHVARASLLVIAIRDAFAARKMLETARLVNPGIEAVVRTHSEEEAELFEKESADPGRRELLCGTVSFCVPHELVAGRCRIP